MNAFVQPKSSRWFALGVVFSFCLLPWVIQAATPSEQVEALHKEMGKRFEEFQPLLQKAKSDAEREALYAKAPKAEDYAPRFLAIAKAHPEDQGAFEALTWIVGQADHTPAAQEALDILQARHVGNPRAGALCMSLVYSQNPKAERFVREVRTQNKSHATQGEATLALARMLSGRDGASKDVEGLLDECVTKFKDVKEVAQAAEAELFGKRNLAIGKVAPDIEGKDIDGKSLKLSDYRGKVVVIDFWGDW